MHKYYITGCQNPVKLIKYASPVTVQVVLHNPKGPSENTAIRTAAVCINKYEAHFVETTSITVPLRHYKQSSISEAALCFSVYKPSAHQKKSSDSWKKLSHLWHCCTVQKML